ncbi:MAG: sulfate ABC transporter ATP-binding protein [Nitrospira sp.]|nr:sulfate ABC transporter ATP-binding protein [Nitrospira sp.]
MSIEVRHITKSFGPFTALNNVSLDVPTGNLVALLGPSGCGKTTLLRIMAGLESPDSGRILFHGEDATAQPVRKRRVGFVFQHYALFRHLTVVENVAFGLRVRQPQVRPSEAEIQEKVHELLQLVQLDWLGDRYPTQLSGGQRQRVALARALAVEPNVLLLDEPFGALDARVRKDLRRWLRRLHDELHITSVFVTHDQEEALEVADRVVVMHQGNVEQIGTPDDVYENPATPFVFQFLGDVNVFHGRFSPEQNIQRYSEGEPSVPSDVSDEHKVTFVRPHDFELNRSRTNDDQLEATVRYVLTAGSRVRVELVVQDSEQTLEVELTKEQYRELDLRESEIVFVHPKHRQVFRIPQP